MYGCNVSVLLNTQLVSLSYLFDLLCPVTVLVHGLIFVSQPGERDIDTFSFVSALSLCLSQYLALIRLIRHNE